MLQKVCARVECRQPFTTPDKIHFREKRYCSRTCANRTITEAREQHRGVGALGYKPPLCPCGEEIQPTPGQRYVYLDNKKYCSAECRATYGKKRQADPANHITIECQNPACGKTITRYRKYGKGHLRFCSNACSNKMTKTVRHYVARDLDMVLDSGWEVLLAGTCFFLKVPIERVDRSTAVELGPKSHYAPDFWLPTAAVHVEVKGQEGPEDAGRWAAWRAQRGPLVVLGRDELDELRRAHSDVIFLAILQELRYAQNAEAAA